MKEKKILTPDDKYRERRNELRRKPKPKDPERTGIFIAGSIATESGKTRPGFYTIETLHPPRILTCLHCNKLITDLDAEYYQGEVITCKHCRGKLVVQSSYGIFDIAKKDPDVSHLMQILRYLNTKSAYQVNLTSRTIRYFQNETLAERYARIQSSTGILIEYGGGKPKTGRSPEEDTIYEGVQYYAVST